MKKAILRQLLIQLKLWIQNQKPFKTNFILIKLL